MCCSTQTQAPPNKKAADAEALVREYERLVELERAAKLSAKELFAAGGDTQKKKSVMLRDDYSEKAAQLADEETREAAELRAAEAKRQLEEAQRRGATRLMMVGAEGRPEDPGPFALTSWRNKVMHLASPFSTPKRRLTPPSSLRLAPKRLFE